jgi:2-aminoadipate transaminase
MPEGVDWTEPTGGFLTWLTLPDGLDTRAMRPAATAAGVAYVPGPPFHVGDSGRNTLRLSFSRLTETELETAVDRLAGVVRGALEQRASSRAHPV